MFNYIFNYIVNKYIVSFEFNNDKIIYKCSFNDNIIFIDYFFGYNAFYEIHYFLILHNYIFDFDKNKIVISFYKKSSYSKFQNMLYNILNKPGITTI